MIFSAYVVWVLARILSIAEHLGRLSRLFWIREGSPRDIFTCYLECDHVCPEESTTFALP